MREVTCYHCKGRYMYIGLGCPYCVKVITPIQHKRRMVSNKGRFFRSDKEKK